MVTAIMTSAAVAAAVMVVMMAIVMRAHHIGVKVQFSCQQSIHRGIGISTDTAVKPDAMLGKGRLGTAANAAADQNIRMEQV